jgi:apolipoprotein N-acyltransferase
MPAVVAILLGAVSVFGYAPFYLYPLTVLALAGLAMLWVRTKTARAAAGIGFCFGLGLFVTGTSWVYVSLHDYGGMPMPIAAGTTLFFCSCLALYPAAIGALLQRAGASRAVSLLVVLPGLWSAAEWVRGWMFTGFPWLALGYSQTPASPLAGYAPVLGVYGVSLVTAAVAGAIALTAERDLIRRHLPGRQRVHAIVLERQMWIAAALLAVGLVFSLRQWTVPLDREPTTVALVQGNIPQELKWRPERARQTLIDYLELTRTTDATLVLLPETALPMFNVDLPHGYLDMLAAHVRAKDGDLLTGVPEYAGPGRFYNSVISVGSSPEQNYRKVHLVPFGDYFPLRGMLGWFMNLLDIPMSDFSRGDPGQRPMEVAGQRVAINICYEDVFGEEIIRQLPEATVLANFTNDAWWGRSLASRQHLQIAQMRSLETGRYMLRATNTGVTAIIDARGRVKAVAPEFETLVLTGEVVGYRGATPFVHWGNLAFLVVAGVMIGAGFASGKRRRK